MLHIRCFDLDIRKKYMLTIDKIQGMFNEMGLGSKSERKRHDILSDLVAIEHIPTERPAIQFSTDSTIDEEEDAIGDGKLERGIRRY